MSDKYLYRRNGVWYFCIVVRGERHRRCLHTTSRTEARQHRDRLVKDLSHQKIHGETRHSWKEAVTRWASDFLPGISPTTAKRYLTSVRQFEHLLSDLYVDQVTNKAVAQVAGRKGPTNATRRRDLTALSSVLRSCVGWGWLETNPAKLYDRGVIPERRDHIVLPEDRDVEALVADLAPGLARLVRFLDLTGCRLEEAAAICHHQVDVKLQECTLLRAKGNKVRTIRLVNPGVPVGREATRETTVRHLETPYVFWHAEGAKPGRYHNAASNLSNHIVKLVEAGKINKFRIHDLRHRFAVRWLKAGGDIYQLSRHLGHASVKTTEVYLAYVPRTFETGRPQTGHKGSGSPEEQ